MNQKHHTVKPRLFPLKGAVDIHSEIPNGDFLRLARIEGLKDVVIKWPGGADSAPVAEFTNLEKKDGTVFWGGIVLDGTVGGMNCAAVKASASRQGRFVWMPTVDALHHRRINGQSEQATVRIIDEQSKLLPA